MSRRCSDIKGIASSLTPRVAESGVNWFFLMNPESVRFYINDKWNEFGILLLLHMHMTHCLFAFIGAACFIAPLFAHLPH